MNFLSAFRKRMSLSTGLGNKNNFNASFLPVDLEHISLMNNFGTSVGYEASSYNMLGIQNTFVGYKANAHVTAISGDANTGVGTEALMYNRASFNTSLGAMSGYCNIFGERNCYLGYSAGYYSLQSSDCVYVGNDAGRYAYGNKNVAVGSFAGNVPTECNHNVSVGYQAQGHGEFSVALGARNSVEGDGSVAVGNNTTVSGARSFVVGNNVTCEGHDSLLVVPDPTGGEYISTEPEELNLYGRLKGKRLPSGRYQMDLLSDKISLDAGDSRIVIDSTGIVLDSSKGLAFDSKAVFTSGLKVIGGISTFETPVFFDDSAMFLGDVSLPNIVNASATKFLVREHLSVEGTAGFCNSVVMDGETDIRDLRSDAIDVDNLLATTVTVESNLSVIGMTETDNLIVSDSFLVDAPFVLFTRDVSMSNNLIVKNDVDIGDQIVFQNRLDPEKISQWTIGLDVPEPDVKPQNADLVLHSSDGTTVKFTQDFESSLLNFTGSHTTSYRMSDSEKIGCIGKIVSSTGEFQDLDGSHKPSIDEAIPIVQLSQRAMDPTVFGVVSSFECSMDRFHRFQIGNLQLCKGRRGGNAKVRVNSVGEGCVLVSDINGPLRNGDLVTTSPVHGIGMAQGDDVLKSYTVAKITQDCVFDGLEFQTSPGGIVFRTALVGCIYKC